MNHEKLTEIVCVLDRSGSMGPIRNDAIGSFNTFLKDQQSMIGEARMTIVLFDDVIEIMHNGTNIKYIPPLTTQTFVPRGSTALLDAVGISISGLKTRIEQIEDPTRKPDAVIFVILTDGQENASREFNYAQIDRMIKTQIEREHWHFVYLSADPRAFEDAEKMGIKQDNVTQFMADADGIKYCCEKMNEICCDIRSNEGPGENIGES